MIDPNEVHLYAQDLLSTLQTERHQYDRFRDFYRGERGAARIPATDNQELLDLRNRSVKNVIRPAIDQYVMELDVIGYANIDSEDNSEAWKVWNDVDLRSHQTAVHRAVGIYGVAYVSILPGAEGPTVRVGTPRNTIGVYETPTDHFPIYGLDTWIDGDDRRHGIFYDEMFAYTVHFGSKYSTKVESVEEGVRHGIRIGNKPVTPLVRFLNSVSGDDEDMIAGDVAPLIKDQEAINTVNFLRLVATKYGAQPQKVILGYSHPSAEAAREVKHGAEEVWTLDSETAKIDQFNSADPSVYTNVLKEQLSHVCMSNGLAPTAIGSSDLVNLSADALAEVGKTHKNYVRTRQAALAGSWKRVLRILGGLEGMEDDASAEVLWRSVESFSSGAVGDLISKAVPQGVPVKYLIGLIPGLTPQQIRNARAEIDEQGAFDPQALFEQAVSDLTPTPRGDE